MPDGFGRYAKCEYERRWLLATLPKGLNAAQPWARITDHYLEGTRFRVRERIALQSGDVVWKLTHKFPEQHGAHDRVVITNNYLTREEYDRFRRLPGRELVKHRWMVEHDAVRYGVDAFVGALAGLILVEREYETHEALLGSSPPPPFEGVEVTDRIEFTGGALAGKTFPEVRRTVDGLLAR